VLGNESLNQAVDPIDDKSVARLPLLRRGIRPSNRAAKSFCAAMRAWCNVTRP
jgi:hypothetical protein